MLRVHKTKEGEKLFISQMADSHLTNTINMLIRKIEGYKGALEAKVNVSPFKAALYEVDVEQFSETAKKRISSTANGLYPYLAEAMLRGIDFKADLQRIFEREGQEGFFGIEGVHENLLEVTVVTDSDDVSDSWIG